MIVDTNIAISVHAFYPLQGQFRIMDCPREHFSRQAVRYHSALTEGCSIHATERLTSIHRDTIMRLGVRMGDGRAALHDELMQSTGSNLTSFGPMSKKSRSGSRHPTRLT
jgi:hypothetical protein